MPTVLLWETYMRDHLLGSSTQEPLTEWVTEFR